MKCSLVLHYLVPVILGIHLLKFGKAEIVENFVLAKSGKLLDVYVNVSAASRIECAALCLSSRKCEAFAVNISANPIVCQLSTHPSIDIANSSGSYGYLMYNKETPQCDDGWIRNPASGQCFWFEQKLLHHADAQLNCEMKGGTLAMLKTTQSRIWLINFWTKSTDWDAKFILLGGYRKDDVFMWDDNSPVNMAYVSMKHFRIDDDCMKIDKRDSSFRSKKCEVGTPIPSLCQKSY
ncbi:hypothetical protein EB796_024884 [Bugula neritina]|uniref:Apple domain-containing protein n=1 Tax=Bugula neritina TaxID=10212 RepID=A0A7J7ISF4_BUGNE|nr:hypothetical protein EB796_024884 [Bugula neritina]